MRYKDDKRVNMNEMAKTLDESLLRMRAEIEAMTAEELGGSEAERQKLLSDIEKMILQRGLN